MWEQVMDHPFSLISIKQYVFVKTLVPHLFISPPSILSSVISYLFLTCPTLISSPHQIGVSVFPCGTINTSGFLHLLFYRGYTCLSKNILIYHFISSNVTANSAKHRYLSYTHLLCMILSERGVIK